MPVAQQNQIQDAIGSFAYIGVTFFLVTSAYGLKWGVVHKENFLNVFWLKRLSVLLIPVLLCNLVRAGVSVVISGSLEIRSLVSINGWVRVHILFYIVFWIIYYFSSRLKVQAGYWQDIIICLIVVACSLIDRLTSVKLTLVWQTESLDFVFALLLLIVLKYLRGGVIKNGDRRALYSL